MSGPTTTSVSYPSLDPRLHVFRHGDTVDTFAVRTERSIVLVDTATRPEAIEAVLDSLRSELSGRSLLVLNTHGDWDHVWGNSVFADPPAPILAHHLAPARMMSADAERFLASVRQDRPGTYDRVRLTPPTITFEHLEIDGGDLTLQLIPTPGHTPDHLAVWIPEIRCLLAGDAAEAPFPLVSEDGSLAALQSSLRLMQNLMPQTVLYCHAAGRTDPGVLAENLAYFDQLEARCRTAHPDAPAADITWPLEEALPPGTALSDIPDLDFYRGFHEANIAAALKEVRHHRPQESERA